MAKYIGCRSPASDGPTMASGLTSGSEMADQCCRVLFLKCGVGVGDGGKTFHRWMLFWIGRETFGAFPTAVLLRFEWCKP
mmetsp:Transcript_93875/g.162508  ORF Transcript_93875/g.162508 Transcript_93875/m.162508 type:complete len:80 (-) Transcript_93875:159-398(-)